MPRILGPRPLPCLAGLALLAGACGKASSTSSAPAAAPSFFNLGLVAQSSEIAADGDLVLVAAREFEDGGHDLDGDGDAFDLVAFLVDLSSGTSENTGLALDASAGGMQAVVRGPLALIAASERASGARDLNGDGDTFDDVVFVHDARDGTTRGLGLALSDARASRPALGGDLAAFAVSEAGQGRDLDGDGDRDGDVLHVYDAAARSLVNTGIDAPSLLFVEDGSVAWFADETGGDRNGDGDTRDQSVLQVFDLAQRTSRDSGLATDGSAPVFAGGAWLVAVPEDSAGRDLDGDGRFASAVLHVFEPGTGVQNLGLASFDSPCALAVRAPGVPEQFAFRVSQVGAPVAPADPGAADGVTLDRALHLYDPRADHLLNTGVASATPPVLAGHTLGFLVLEADQDVDLDGDGSLDHAVAFATDASTGLTVNLRQEAVDVRGSGGLLLLARRESAAESDWNGDGDRADVVVHALDPATASTTNTRIASVDAFGVGGGRLLLYADELAQGADLNGDRDQGDQVFVLFDLVQRSSVTTNLAGGFDAGRFGRVTGGGHLAVLANELAQGRDLNADGDLSDDVLYRGE